MKNELGLITPGLYQGYSLLTEFLLRSVEQQGLKNDRTNVCIIAFGYSLLIVHVWMYVCMYVCMHVCLYIDVCMHVCIVQYVMYKCVCLCVCMCVCMYVQYCICDVCMYVCM